MRVEIGAGLFVAVSDSALGQIVRGKFQGNPVARQHSNAVAAQLAGQVGEHRSFLIQLYAEQSAWEFFYNGSSNFNAIFFAHPPPPKLQL